MLCPTYPLGELDFPFAFVMLNMFALAALLTSVAFRMLAMLGGAFAIVLDRFCLFKRMLSVVLSMKTLLD